MKNSNLLHNNDFIEALHFEAGYAANVRGGSLSPWLDNEKKKRLISDVNLLNERERKDLAKLFYIGKN